MKRCNTCGEEKEESEFPPVAKPNVYSPDECKSCRRIKTLKRNRDSVKANDIIYNEVKKKACERNKKVHRCAKIFCKKIDREKIIEITCPVCGLVFGVTKTEYNGVFNYFGRPPKYCSRPCYHISTTKKWQQRHSPYAKKIIDLIKENP